MAGWNPGTTGWNTATAGWSTATDHRGGNQDFTGFIDNWLTENSNQDNFQYQGITKNHWKPNNARSQCGNHGCRKKFTITDRRHHCRRCGDLFCNQCTQYKRRLNNLANLDPGGTLQKVCKLCSDDGPQGVGWMKDLSAEFRKRRSEGMSSGQLMGKTNIQVECDRLINGFRESFQSSGFRKSLSDVKNLMKTPEWKKPKRYTFYKLSPRCYGCQEEFGTIKNKQYYCTICGKVMCSKCSSKELIVYIPNELKNDKDQIKLAIIRVVGCPQKEPDFCAYLRTCESCKQYLEQSQVEEYRQMLFEEESGSLWSAIESVREKLEESQYKIDDSLPKFHEIISSMEIDKGAPSRSTSKGSNIQTLAKVQEDLMDYFSIFMCTVETLKRVKPSTAGQQQVLKNMLMSKYTTYQESMYKFIQSKKKLENLVPNEILQVVQSTVETNAINGAFIYCKRLTLETIHLCTRYKLSDEISRNIAQVVEILEQDLKLQLLSSNENYASHEKQVNILLKGLMKEHRLIRPSENRIKNEGTSHVQTVILWRSDALLAQIIRQLSTKTREKSFKQSKMALDELRVKIKELAEK